MLSEIRITGLGVIEDATLDLDPGFTAVTGETGAGKTMVVTGVNMLLGGRADSGLVRHGTRRARVEGRASGVPRAIVQQAEDRGGEQSGEAHGRVPWVRGQDTSSARSAQLKLWSCSRPAARLT